MIWIFLLFLTIVNTFYCFMWIYRIELPKKITYLGRILLYIPPIGILFTIIMLLYAITTDTIKQIKILKGKW